MESEIDDKKRQRRIGPRFLYLALILCALSACGKKGPLYLPPGIIPILKPVQASTVGSSAEPAVTPAAEATKKISPATTSSDKTLP